MMKPRIPLAALLFMVATPVLAHEGMHGPGSEYDVDESGDLTLNEYQIHLKETKQDQSNAAQRFKTLDANKDGVLTSAEFIKGLAASGKEKRT
jgi:hypothetical protein